MIVDVKEVEKLQNFDKLSEEEKLTLMKDAENLELRRCDKCGRILDSEWYCHGDEDYCSEQCIWNAGKTVEYIMSSYSLDVPPYPEIDDYIDAYMEMGERKFSIYCQVRARIKWGSVEKAEHEASSFISEVQLESDFETIAKLNGEI